MTGTAVKERKRQEAGEDPEAPSGSTLWMAETIFPHAWVGNWIQSSQDAKLGCWHGCQQLNHCNMPHWPLV